MTYLGTIDGVPVYLEAPDGIELSNDEALAYVEHVTAKNGRKPDSLSITLDGDFAELFPVYRRPFERIRRITGYLQKTDNWNDAKRAEGADRVKHGVSHE